MKIQKLKEEISKLVIGQEVLINSMLCALLCDGHILLEGVPGLAKTTAVKTLAKAINLNFKRVQFTPDLLPNDIIGMQIFNQKENNFFIKKGPVFTNLLLADEINRSPAKVQSALLEAMQEKQVTIGEESFKLPLPFLVLATQNPIESEGAYELPQAQLDRFMMKILVSYNTKEEEKQIIKQVVQNDEININKILDIHDINSLRKQVKEVYIDDELLEYITDIIFASRNTKKYNIKTLEDVILFGASPRGSIDLLKTAKAHAFLKQRKFVMPTDIVAMAKDVLRHRIMLTYEAQASGINSDYVIEEILKNIQIP